MLIAFLRFSIHRDSMGQQHRVKLSASDAELICNARKHRSELSQTRPIPAKQQAQKESVAAE